MRGTALDVNITAMSNWWGAMPLHPTVPFFSLLRARTLQPALQLAQRKLASTGRFFACTNSGCAGGVASVLAQAVAHCCRYNNHNSNAVSFHRVRGFRRYANVQWATYEGQYTLRPRVMSSTS